MIEDLRDAVGEGPCLAAAGSRQDKERSVHVLDTARCSEFSSLKVITPGADSLFSALSRSFSLRLAPHISGCGWRYLSEGDGARPDPNSLARVSGNVLARQPAFMQSLARGHAERLERTGRVVAGDL